MADKAINLLAVLKNLTMKYIAAVIKAPARQTWVFNQRVNGKSDVRKEYLANMRNLAEVAVQVGDTKAQDYIKMCINDETEEEIISDLKSTLKGK